jgi:hypothetical protein
MRLNVWWALWELMRNLPFEVIGSDQTETEVSMIIMDPSVVIASSLFIIRKRLGPTSPPHRDVKTWCMGSLPCDLTTDWTVTGGVAAVSFCFIIGIHSRSNQMTLN